MLGIGDLADRSVPLEKCVATLRRAMDYGLNLVDTAPMYVIDYNQPLQPRPRGKFSSGGTNSAASPRLPHLSVAECLHYTLTIGPDVALLGLSFPNEQDAAFRAFEEFRPLAEEKLRQIEHRAREAVAGKGRCWWNPTEP